LRVAALSVDRSRVSTTVAAEQAEAIALIPGAQTLPTVLTKRGEKQVAIRFNLAAREAVEKTVHKDYVEKVEASDNLRWSLGSGGGMAAADKPLGKAAPAAAGASGADQ
jgi:hypothetical protein